MNLHDAIKGGRFWTLSDKTYDGTGRVTQKDLANGTKATFTFDATGNRLTETNHGFDLMAGQAQLVR